MIVLFTDFGYQGPYVGQMKAVLYQQAPGVAVVDLMHDAPVFDPLASAYLLAALVEKLPAGCVILAVVDPGVGSEQRRAVVLEADGRWFVGPGNGLFGVVAQRAQQTAWWEIDWRPRELSASFHGRDLFAPVAARLARGEAVPGKSLLKAPLFAAPMDLAKVIYFDGFGNAITGLRASTLPPDATIEVAGQRFSHARTFSAVPVGAAFWYANANGLVEIAVNRGRAADLPGLALGAELDIG